MRFRFRLHPLYEPETGTGSGGGQGGTDPAAAFRSALEKHQGDATRFAETLYGDNFRYRERIRELEAQAPAQGAVVLAAEDAARWQAYQQHGDPAAIGTGLQERQTLQAELTSLRRDLEIRDVAAISGYSLDVLRTLAGETQFVIRDETKDGKAVKVVKVKDGENEVPLDQHATQKWAAFLPALRPQAAVPAHGTPRQGAQARPAQQTETPRRSTVRF